MSSSPVLSDSSQRPLIVIVSPTASGKTALAIKVAKKFGGEIIAADSRTVFREMDIGTAKPTISEQSGVPHWGLDLVDPGERFTAAQFQAYASDVVSDIRSRGKLPIVVGGTGLYVDGLVFSYDYPAEVTPEVRHRFEAMTTEELYAYCTIHNIELPINDKNKRHLVRAAAHSGDSASRHEDIITGSHMFGVVVDSGVLRQRIRQRTEQMFENGIVLEARKLGKKYGWDSEAMIENVYPLIRQQLEGAVSSEQVKEVFETRDWQLAKRQMTWFRRNPFIAWGKADDIYHQISRVVHY